MFLFIYLLYSFICCILLECFLSFVLMLCLRTYLINVSSFKLSFLLTFTRVQLYLHLFFFQSNVFYFYFFASVRHFSFLSNGEHKTKLIMICLKHTSVANLITYRWKYLDMYCTVHYFSNFDSLLCIRTMKVFFFVDDFLMLTIIIFLLH